MLGCLQCKYTDCIFICQCLSSNLVTSPLNIPWYLLTLHALGTYTFYWYYQVLIRIMVNIIITTCKYSVKHFEFEASFCSASTFLNTNSSPVYEYHRSMRGRFSSINLHYTFASCMTITISWKYHMWSMLWENHPLQGWKIGWFCHIESFPSLLDSWGMHAIVKWTHTKCALTF